MEEIELTLEDNLKLKESIEWGFNYYTEELKELGYSHQVKDNNELEIFDEEGNFVGKSFLEKEGLITTRKFEATTGIQEQVAELSNQILALKITLGYIERDIALLQQKNLVKETVVEYGKKEEVPARIFPAPEHGNLKNISFEGIPSEEVRNYLKEHSWRYSRRNRAWYPGTKEAQSSNEEFVKNFLQKFYPNTLSEEQIPQTLFDTIPEERETEAIPESDVNNPHSDFPDVDNQDMAEPVPESSNQEQSSPEAIAPKTEYTFTPTVGEDGIIDYTGVEVDKIRLPNKTQILNQFLPSYLPPVEIRREGRYDIPAVKVADNQYLLKGTKKGGPIYRVSLDVYAALVDYHLKYDRAARKAIADYNNNVLKEALENEQAEFFPLRTKLPSIPEPLSFESHCQPERKRVSSRYQYSPGRVAFQQSSSHRMTSEVYYFIESEIGSGNSNIFSHHRKNLEELQQKMLDMELQHSDLESTWTKGRETAYGDTNLDESLLDTYGVNIKRQNGEPISAKEKTELQEVLNQVYSTYGNLSSITKDYGLKISHSGNTKMHASKAVGLFTPSMKALGISFGLGKDEAIYTAVHEMAHFIDHVRGQEKHAWHASDIPGTLENRIATTFRKGMNNAKGDYWNRTCECFARAMEEYGKIVHIQQKHPDWDKDKINEQISTPAYMDYTKFYSTMIPLIQEWIETTRNEMKIDEWSLPNSLDQKNIENDKITKSQSKGFREECLEILKKDDAQITDEDLAKLRSYEGAGGLGEKNASVNGVLNEFYTPNLVVQKMWQLADAYVPNAITVLEPTAGTGRFAEGRNNNQFTMYEVDKTSARINQLLHPQATVINESFQKQFFDPEGRAINRSYSIPKFDLVIGNPPYGDYKDKWHGLGEGKEFDRYEEYFLSRGIDSLKNQDSLMIMIVPSGFLNSNEDKVKQAISSKGKLLDAWRLPEGVFPTTKVGTDILVFQRGSCQVQELCNGNWFKNHPEKILGEVKTRINRFGKQEEYVDFFAGHTLSDTLNLLVPDKSIDKLLETSSNFIEETLQENQPKEFANAESIHQGDRERETHLRGEGVGGQTREDNGTNVPGQDPRGGGIIKEPGSPDSTVTRKPVQQPSLQHNSPAPEGNDSHTSGSLGNQAGRQGGMEPHTTPLPGSIEQLSDRLTLSAQEFSRFYTGNNFSTEEYPILLATDWQGQVDSSKLTPSQCEWLKSSQKYIQVEEGKFVNRNIFCSGNIYHKLAELESRKDTIPTELYNIQKKALEESLPPIKSLDKVELSPLGSLAQTFQVTRQLSRTNYDYLSHKNIQTTSQESIPLAEDFIAWATGCYNKDAENSRRYISDWTTANISREDLPSNVSWSDIVDYIEGVSVKSSRAYTEEGKNAARIEAEEKRQARKETAEQLFNRYIRTALPEHDREQLTQEWNKRFNSYVAPDYSKLPVLVDGMSTRKDNKPFELYEQQVKGVAFLTQKGNGLLAYDVGVGKTAAGIVATVSQLQSGRAKRPLIIVPKAVYTKWIHDFQQLFPEIPINDLANFSPKALESLNNGNHGLTIPEGSISFCTNEALQRITFEDESIAGALFEDFSNLLGKSEEAHSDNAKIRAKAISAINDEIGSASQTKDDYVFFERCGFDHITVDEAHRFKNLFRVPRSSKPDSKGMSQEFPGLGQGTPSKRAMKMFAITQMVQRNNDNRNVFMLTATPFTNSPLEVYSMLSYIGREQLKSSGVYDIRDFCTEYAHVTNEWAVDAKGAIKPKSVMKSFRNPQSLQSLITQYIDKVDGEEAGIRRPNKEQHQIQLEMNEVQKMIVARETERMLDPEEKDKGGVLVAMNNMRMAMVSPALLDPEEYPEIEDFPTDIVESSPKLQYVCDTVSKVWTEKKDCGQVIYMPYGVKEMDAVKDALVKRGIPASCIALIRAGDNLSEEKIDEITSNFNDKNHKLKILIGSKKIAEGVDLNGNSITLYNTMLDWNPTETIQVEGRIWRQGNKQERVHIMYPLMEDSIESLIFQKHDEKSNRINDIFSYKGDDALDVSSINPEELKFDLIKDPEKKADFIISQKTVEMKKELTVIDARISTLNEIAFKKANLQDLLKMAESSRKEMQERLDFPEKREKWFSESLAKEVVKNSKTEIIQLTAKLDTVNRRMQKMGLSDEASLENLRSTLEGQKEILQKQIDMVASSKDEIIAEEKIILLEKKAAAVPFQQQVDQMVRQIIENTREAPQKERRIEEHHKKVSEKPQSVSTPQRQENPTFKKFESLIESAKADIHPIRMKSIKKTLDLISQKINEGNPQITQLISDFDPVQENHVMAGMTTKKAYAYDIMYKLLPQCNAIIQEERKQAFEQDKVPYIHLEWSESPIFPFENSYYSIKEFNELIENEDRRFYNERERIIQKYGSYEKYYAIPKEELPIEDRNVSLGYDKTKFQILNLPTMDKTDTISYGADRYDIGDGYGSIFDFVRETCTYPQVIEALNNLENELYFPSVSQEQKDKVQTIIEGNKKSLEKSLSNHLNLYHEVRMQEEEQRKSILVDITKTNLLKDQKKNALQNIKDSYNHSIASIFGEAKSMDIPKEYAINETKKFVTEMLYTPPSSWNEMGEIWSLFPATCNFTETLQELYEQQTKVQPVREERTQDSLAIEIASNEKQLPENESPIEYPVGKYGQLELFAFEQTPSYNNSMKAFTDELVTVLNATAIELPELPLTRDNYKKLFDRGYVESPIETLKMGENQYEKFKRTDRNNLLAAAYMTLTQPSLILEKETYDEKSEQFKPVHVYGKSFYRKESGNHRVVESIVIFKEENRIIISSHNKDVKDFVKQIKTADQIVYMDKEVGRVATWLQEKAGDHVPLQGINTRVINLSYNTDNLVSIPSLIQNSSATTVQEPFSKYITSGDPSLTKEHTWRAKAATRTYCNPILDGKKSGLWKNFRDFKKHGVLDILGANAEMEQGKITPQGWNQLATALQIYRDKRFETFRYLFVSPEGKIQDQLAVCSHLPGKTLSNLPSENLLGQVITHAEETGTKVVLVHNHPSGNITPSVDDIRMTKTTEAAFTRSDGKCLLAGHIILDHDSYSLYQKGKEWEARMLSPYDIYDPLLKTRNPLEAITVSGPESLELVAQAVNSHDKWKEEGWVPVVFTNSSSQISAVKMYPEDFLTQNNAKLLSQLQETAKRTGAIMAFPIILDKNHISQENQKNLLDRMKAGCFTDFYLGEKDGNFRTSEDFNLIPGKNLFDEVGMEQMAVHTTITSTFQRHQKQEMESLGVFVAEDTRNEYESFLGQIDDYLEKGKTPPYHQFLISKTPSILTFTGVPDNGISLSTSVLNKAKKVHRLDNEEIIDSVKGLFNPILVFNSDKSTSEAKNDSILIITEATAKNGKPVVLALELEKELSNRKQVYVVNDIRSIHDRNIVAQNGVDIMKKWTEKGLLKYYDDKKISDWLAIKRVQFPLSLTKSDMGMIADKNTSVKTRSQFENSMMKKIYQSDLPEKLLTPAQVREGKQELPVKQSFMVKNSFLPPMELAKNGQVQLYCSREDLQNPISQDSQEIKPVVLEMTPKQAAVLVDASIKKQSMENRHSKQQLPLNLPVKSKMEESFFTGLKNVHPQLTRKEAERQYHEVYSMIEKELKELRSEPAREKKNPTRRGFSMEW